MHDARRDVSTSLHNSIYVLVETSVTLCKDVPHLSTRHMYDYEYPYDIEYSSHDYLDEEYQYSDDLDDDHPRDSHTWQEIAYMHFA